MLVVVPARPAMLLGDTLPAAQPLDCGPVFMPCNSPPAAATSMAKEQVLGRGDGD